MRWREVSLYECGAAVAYGSPKPLTGVRISPLVQFGPVGPLHVVAVATLFFLQAMDKLSNYFRATIEEMRYNVTWPSTTELQKSAGLVLIGSLIFAVVVGVMDISFESVLKAFYNSFR